jgi:hypothetical protein
LLLIHFSVLHHNNVYYRKAKEDRLLLKFLKELTFQKTKRWTYEFNVSKLKKNMGSSHSGKLRFKV